MGFHDLLRVLQSLLGYLEDGQRHCLLRCEYLHAPRHRERWDPATAEGHVLNECAAHPQGGLLVCADPAAAPQLLTGHEVDEAKETFLKTATLRLASSVSTADRPEVLESEAAARTKP